jgi:CheY-like chemotaxis protein
MQGDRERCFASGMGGYISKPTNALELEETINAVFHDKTEVDSEKTADKHRGEKNALEYG